MLRPYSCMRDNPHSQISPLLLSLPCSQSELPANPFSRAALAANKSTPIEGGILMLHDLQESEASRAALVSAWRDYGSQVCARRAYEGRPAPPRRAWAACARTHSQHFSCHARVPLSPISSGNRATRAHSSPSSTARIDHLPTYLSMLSPSMPSPHAFAHAQLLPPDAPASAMGHVRRTDTSSSHSEERESSVASSHKILPNSQGSGGGGGGGSGGRGGASFEMGSGKAPLRKSNSSSNFLPRANSPAANAAAGSSSSAGGGQHSISGKVGRGDRGGHNNNSNNSNSNSNSNNNASNTDHDMWR